MIYIEVSSAVGLGRLLAWHCLPGGFDRLDRIARCVGCVEVLQLRGAAHIQRQYLYPCARSTFGSAGVELRRRMRPNIEIRLRLHFTPLGSMFGRHWNVGQFDTQVFVGTTTLTAI